MDSVLISNEGLLREGPQCVGCLKPSWISIRTRAVLACFGIVIVGDVLR